MDKTLSRKFRLFGMVFTIIIVIFHSNIQADYFAGNWDRMLYISFDSLVNWLRTAALSYFFMASGFFMYKGLTRQLLPGRIGKRFFSLVIPFFLWNVFFLGYFYLLYRLIPERYGNPLGADLFLRLTTSPQDYPLWYIVTLLMFVAMTPVLFYFKKYPHILISLTVCAIGAYHYYFISHGEIGSAIDGKGIIYSGFITYLPSFMGGGCFWDCLTENGCSAHVISGCRLVHKF